VSINQTTERVLIYAAAAAIGVAVLLWAMPLVAMIGAGPGWNPPGPDQAQSLTGHLAFQADQWRWPLLMTERLFWPHGVSLALVDSNPLVSIMAKIWSHATGSAPANWLGGFIAACFVLQPVAGVYAARGLRVGPVAALVAGLLAACWPAMMFRMMHINLCAHFLLLLALGMAFRRIERPLTWLAPAALLVVSILTHPYLFQLCAAVLAAVPLHAWLKRRPGWQRESGQYLLSGVAAVALLILMAGPLGGGDKGYAFFSMNLGSPVWPQVSGVFGKGLPILDGTGGQYEGFNWLGAGTMLLLLAALVAAVATRRWPRPALALVIVLGALFLLSLGSRVYLGPVKLVDLGTKPWEDLFGSFRSAGRAFWPVGYALMLAGVAGIDRLPRRLAVPLLVAAAGLQVVDIGPMRTRVHDGWANGSGIVMPAVPGGTTLFTVAPHPGCAADLTAKLGGPIMILDAVRHGAQAEDVGLGRSPPWFNCETVIADALELPLLQHEVRAFVGAGIQAGLSPLLLGPRAVCKRAPAQAELYPGLQTPGTPGTILCGNDVADFPGEAIPMPPSLPAVTLPYERDPDDIGSVLGFGWLAGLGGGAWSEGPRSSLLIPVPTGKPLELRLRAAGVGFKPGEARIVRVTSGRLPVGQFSLPDGLITEVTVAIPASTIVGGILRVSLDVFRPVDPARRGIKAPVKRAAIQLSGVSLKLE